MAVAGALAASEGFVRKNWATNDHLYSYNPCHNFCTRPLPAWIPTPLRRRELYSWDHSFAYKRMLFLLSFLPSRHHVYTTIRQVNHTYSYRMK